MLQEHLAKNLQKMSSNCFWLKTSTMAILLLPQFYWTNWSNAMQTICCQNWRPFPVTRPKTKTRLLKSGPWASSSMPCWVHFEVECGLVKYFKGSISLPNGGSLLMTHSKKPLSTILKETLMSYQSKNIYPQITVLNSVYWPLFCVLCVFILNVSLMTIQTKSLMTCVNGN